MQARLDRRTTALAIALLLALAWVTAAGAQPRQEEKANIAVTGDITAIDVAGRKITLEDSNEKTAVYDVGNGATIMYEGKGVELGDLKVGWNVAVNGHELRGNRTLTYIKVVKSPAP